MLGFKLFAELLVSSETLLILWIVGLIALGAIITLGMKSVETPDITEPKD